MKITELHQKILSKKLPSVLIFIGAEVGVRDIYLQKIQEVTAASVLSADTVSDAYGRMVKQSMSNEPRIFVVRYDLDFIKQSEKIWANVFQAADGFSNSLILLFSNLDKRGKFYKQFAELIVEFETLSEEVLCNYIEKELPGLSKKDKKTLITVCESDYSRILLECDKIRMYLAAESDFRDLSYSEALDELISNGIIYQPIGDITFKLTDAILTRDISSTLHYLLLARNKSEPEMVVLSVLYNGFKQILMVQGLGESSNDAVARTGLTSWQVKMAKDKMGHYTIGELVFNLKKTRFAEMGIKSGQIDAESSLEYLVVNILKGG